MAACASTSGARAWAMWFAAPDGVRLYGIEAGPGRTAVVLAHEGAQTCVAATLAADGQLTGPPANVGELQPGDLSAAQRQPRHRQDDGVITAATGAVAVAACQHRAQMSGYLVVSSCWMIGRMLLALADCRLRLSIAGWQPRAMVTWTGGPWG
jgi:hypothetical protein